MFDEMALWLETVKNTSVAFIQDHYPGELSLFDSFWLVVSDKISHALQDVSDYRLSREKVSQLAHQALSGGQSLDLVTPIVIGTIMEVVIGLRSKKLTVSELEKTIRMAATRFGAKPGLTACLQKHIPVMIIDIMAKGDDKEALVSIAPSCQYRIWTEGKVIEVDDISKYEKRKKQYVIWLDIDERPKKPMSNEARRLIIYLVERIGILTPVSDIIRDVFQDTMRDDPKLDKGRIEQQMTKLNTLSRRQFLQYRFDKWFECGLGLKIEFSDKYFLFERNNP